MDLEARTIDRVTWRLVPFLIGCYFVAYLDRVNVGFAAITMNKDLGISQTAYGLGAGIFFISYFLFEVPSNLFLERFGSRKWIAPVAMSIPFALRRGIIAATSCLRWTSSPARSRNHCRIRLLRSNPSRTT